MKKHLKKTLSLFLTLCMIASLFVICAMPASAAMVNEGSNWWGPVEVELSVKAESSVGESGTAYQDNTINLDPSTSGYTAGSSYPITFTSTVTHSVHYANSNMWGYGEANGQTYALSGFWGTLSTNAAAPMIAPYSGAYSWTATNTVYLTVPDARTEKTYTFNTVVGASVYVAGSGSGAPTAQAPVTVKITTYCTHTNNLVTNYDDTNHWQHCNACGADWTSAPHSWSETSRSGATCTGTGTINYKCTGCAKTTTGSYGPNGHSFTGVCAQASAGKHYYKCASCDAYGVGTTAGATENCTYTDTVVNPTCTAGGYTRHTCSKCGYSYSDTETPQTAHSYQYTSQDKTQHLVTCANCNTVHYTANHNFENGVCTYCGATQVLTVTYLNYNGGVWDEFDVNYGENAPLPDTNPTRDPSGDTAYEFTGWSGNTSHITRNRTFIAQYKPVVRDSVTGGTTDAANYYTVRFFADAADVANNDPIYTVYVEAGGTADFPASLTPEKAGYTFKNWDKSLANVRQDRDLIARFTRDGVEAIATFVNYDGAFLANYIVNIGDTAENLYDGATPTRADAVNTYAFAGWDQDVTAPITGDKTFTATFTETGAHTHDYSIPNYNAAGHWMECACGEQETATPHTLGYTSGNNGTHTAACADCGYSTVVACDYETEAHDANCQHGAYTTYTCKNCGYTYNTAEGAVGSHSFTGDYRQNADNTHSRKCLYCELYGFGTTVDGKEACAGGDPATCSAKSVCASCGEAYGDYGDHAFTGATRQNSDDTHSYKCLYCGAYGVGTTENATEACASATDPANCQVRATCDVCGENFGGYGPHDFSGAYRPVTDGKHNQKCLYCDAYGVGATADATEDCVCGAVVIDPTCISQGYTTHTCPDCGYNYKDSYVDPTGVHTYNVFDEGTDRVPATCVDLGYDIYHCDNDPNCTATEIKNYTAAVDPANHAGPFHTEGAVAATCANAGYTGNTICEACGHVSAYGAPINAGAHNFVKTETVIAPNCVSGGYDVYECTECHITENRANGTAADPAAHTGREITVGRVEATDYADGYTGDTYCLDCGVLVRAGEAIPCGHTHSFTTEIESVAATCVAKAYTVKQCACGATERTESGEVDATAHTGREITVNAKDATVTEDGYTGDVYCKDCDAFLRAGTVIPCGHEHSFTVTESGDATCVAKAYEIRVCECGETQRVETGELNPANHAGEIKLLGAHDATATGDGYSGDTYCLACGNLIEEGHVLPHTGSGTSDPGTSDPGTSDPGTSDPGTSDPGTSDPGTSDPGTSGGGKCPFCGEVHTGWLGIIISFIHNILYFLLKFVSC